MNLKFKKFTGKKEIKNQDWVTLEPATLCRLRNCVLSDDGSHLAAGELGKVHDVFAVLGWNGSSFDDGSQRFAAGRHGFHSRNAKPHHDGLRIHSRKAEKWRSKASESIKCTRG